MLFVAGYLAMASFAPLVALAPALLSFFAGVLLDQQEHAGEKAQQCRRQRHERRERRHRQIAGNEQHERYRSSPHGLSPSPDYLSLNPICSKKEAPLKRLQ